MKSIAEPNKMYDDGQENTNILLRIPFVFSSCFLFLLSMDFISTEFRPQRVYRVTVLYRLLHQS